MSGEKPLEDALDGIEDLPVEKRSELFRRLQAVTLDEYLKQRGTYIDELRDAEVLGQFAGEGVVSEYCREQPHDPICLQPSSDGELSENWTRFLWIRKLFVAKLEQTGLLHAESDPSEGSTERIDPLTLLTGIPSPRLEKPGTMIPDCDPWDIECWFPGTFREGDGQSTSTDEQIRAILEYCQYYPEDPRCQLLTTCPSPYPRSRPDSSDTETQASVQAVLQSNAAGGGCVEVFEALSELRDQD